MTAICPQQFLFACDIQDLFIIVGVMIGVIVLVVMLGIFIYFRGEWGSTFYHADKSNVGIQFEASGSVKAYHKKPFGGLEKITTGDQKGSYVIPRPGAAYKSPKAPLVSAVVGGGIAYEENPYLAPYIERMGGKWPDWSGPPPPKKPTDLASMYLMYAEWKSQGEKASATDRSKYVALRLAEVNPPAHLVGTPLNDWTKAQMDEFGRDYDAGAWGPFSKMASDLKQMTDEADPAKIKLRYGIYERLNSAIMSEPRELWPTWIVGHEVSLKDLAAFASPVPASEIEAAMNKIEAALRSDAVNTLLKLAGVAFLFIGIGIGGFILIKAVGG